MERRVLAALAVATIALVAGCGGTLSGGTSAGDGGTKGSGEVALEEQWRAGMSAVQGNHHAVAAGRVNGEAVIVVPIGGRRGEAGCRLLVLDGTGQERWREPIDPDACTIHAVADPALADFVGDDRPEVLAATTEEQVVAYEAASGEPSFRYQLSTYGYTKPVVADVTGDGPRELVVSDVRGELTVVRPDGSAVWSVRLEAYAWSRPAVANFSGDADSEVVLGLGNGSVIAFDATGRVAWRTGVDGAVTWTTDGDVDDDGTREFIVATTSGVVSVFDGQTGRIDWSRDLGRFAAVGTVTDADGDGDVEVYVTARDARLRALDGRDGTLEWERQLTDADVQMTPPPVIGDVTGDGAAEIVAVTNDGRVHVLSPAGELLATYSRDVSVFTHATLADTDDDDALEIYVMYGDGTVVALGAR